MTRPPPELLAARRAALSSAVTTEGLAGLLIESLPNITYLTGFVGSAGVLLATDRLHLLVDGRYTTVAEGLAVGEELRNATERLNRMNSYGEDLPEQFVAEPGLWQRKLEGAVADAQQHDEQQRR